MVRMCELMTLACATALVAGSAGAAVKGELAKSAKADTRWIAPESAREAVGNNVVNADMFAGPSSSCRCTWDNGVFDRRTGQVSHLGGAVPQGMKAADDFSFCDGFVYDIRTISARLLTTTFVGLVKPKAEIWSDCSGCPRDLLYTLEKGTVVELGTTFGTTPAPDSRALREVDVTFSLATEPVVANRNIVLKGGQYWLSIYGQTDGLGPIMQMYDVTYWGTSNNQVIRGLPAKKIAGNPSAVYNVFTFPAGCDIPAPATNPGWISVANGCCVGCTDLNFCIDTVPCKIVIDNGGARAPVVNTDVIGSTSQFATSTNSPFETRTADDFVLSGCTDYRICYVEGCVLTNCPVFDGVFEIYTNDCNRPNYALHGTAAFGPFLATKIIPLGFAVQSTLDGQLVNAYKLEFHDLTFSLPGGRQYWISVGVRYSFSLLERGGFCYNDDCRRTCLIRWNEGRVLTATSIDAASAAIGGNTPGWAKTGHDYSFLIAADEVGTPGPINSQPTCAADFNIDGTLNTQDIFDFLSSWFTGCP